MVIRPPGGPEHHHFIRTRMNPFVRDMHDGNGLWREATDGTEAWDLAGADTALRGWIAQHTDGPVPLAGSGVGHLDLPFVKAFLPGVATRLTYWPLDIGNIRRGLGLAGRDDLVDLDTDVNAKPHRGLGDVELHVAEGRRYLGLLAGIPSAAQ